ncbi:hypothetical protein AG0111_0g10129 [Alternaria gaisen]|uniref:Uncharacterized protein n=1 Tax=Alternaria gaisen TaxID=167740 RepID=A0ACB6FAT3_9PLEO|nr:hypothetical protein AG0111_0g10129 [Alternaria gaisen]
MCSPVTLLQLTHSDQVSVHFISFSKTNCQSAGAVDSEDDALAREYCEPAVSLPVQCSRCAPHDLGNMHSVKHTSTHTTALSLSLKKQNEGLSPSATATFKA